jgi:hypothetical protein
VAETEIEMDSKSRGRYCASQEMHSSAAGPPLCTGKNPMQEFAVSEDWQTARPGILLMSAADLAPEASPENSDI